VTVTESFTAAAPSSEFTAPWPRPPRAPSVVNGLSDSPTPASNSRRHGNFRGHDQQGLETDESNFSSRSMRQQRRDA
jgi:hypothetical protein